eukprot:IDg13566t1
MASFDYLSLQSILLSWSIHMGIASVWYSDIMFNPTCITLAHNGKRPPMSRPGLIASALGAATAQPFFCFILKMSGCRSALEGALWGTALALFDLGLNCSHSFFEERSFMLFLVHRGCHTLSLITIGGLLGALCS